VIPVLNAWALISFPLGGLLGGLSCRPCLIPLPPGRILITVPFSRLFTSVTGEESPDACPLPFSFWREEEVMEVGGAVWAPRLHTVLMAIGLL